IVPLARISSSSSNTAAFGYPGYEANRRITREPPMRAILVLLAAGISCGCGGTDSPPTKIAPLATSAPTTVDELAEEYSLGEYGIRPPKGFELKSDDDMPGMKGRLAVWRSADDRRALSAAIFTVPAALLPATREKVRTLGRPKGMTDVDESGFSFKTISGLVF